MKQRFKRFDHIQTQPDGLRNDIGGVFSQMLKNSVPADLVDATTQPGVAEFTASMVNSMAQDLNVADTAETPWLGQHNPLGDY